MLKVIMLSRMNRVHQVVNGTEFKETTFNRINDMGANEFLDLYEGSVMAKLMTLPVKELLDLREQTQVAIKRKSDA
jgi:hypothetical protein